MSAILNDRLKELKAGLRLSQLEHESGLFVVHATSAIAVTAADGKSPASNCIYYALTRAHPQNHLHWLLPDDYHILIEGGPADYFIFHSDGSVARHTLGREISKGHSLIVASPGGCRKAIRLHEGVDFILVGSVVTPAWNADRVSFGAGQAFIDRYSTKADWATPDFLKTLIGPNWTENTP